MANALSKYALINAKLRGRISNILPDETFRQLTHASSLDATLALLRDTPFASLEEIYSRTGDLKLAELELLKNEIYLYREIKKHLHPNSVPLVDALLYQYEIDNLKNAIRVYFDRVVRGRSVDTSIHYILHDPIVHDLPIDVICNAQSFDEISGMCEGTPYSQIIRQYDHVVESEGSLFRLEVALDHFYYENLQTCIQALDKKDRETAVRLVGVEVDLQNISWIIRFKNYYDLPLETILPAIIPGGHMVLGPLVEELYNAKDVTSMLQGFVQSNHPELSTLLTGSSSDISGRLSLIRRILEEIKANEIRRTLSGYPFTIGIILTYFLLKQNELKKIKTLLNAKSYGREPERIESLI